MIYEISLWPHDLESKFTLSNSVLGAVKLAKNADLDNNSYCR